jgi:hypothetical protein
MRTLLIAALLALAAAASVQAAQTVDISADNAKANATFQKKFGMGVTCPDTATIGEPFTCTYTNASGVSAPVQYVIRKPGKDRVAVSDRQENAALSKAIPLGYWIGIGEGAYNKEKSLKGATLDCPDDATAPSQRITCTLTAKNGQDSAEVQMRFKPVKPIGWALVPVSEKKFAGALLLVT